MASKYLCCRSNPFQLHMKLKGFQSFQPASSSSPSCTPGLKTVKQFLRYHCQARFKSTKTPSKSNKSKRYADSLNLPQTIFPLTMKHGAAFERELRIQKTKSFQSLYSWQQDQDRDNKFVLHDGPPYANGKLHVGHVVNKVLKDILNRFKVMTNHKVHYTPGWDCHGMPIEMKAITNNDGTLKKLSPSEIRGKARRFAESTLDEQKTSFKSWGIMADWKSSYKTLDKAYEARQLEIFYQIYEKGYMYRDYMPVYWSPSSQTALAEAELEYNRDHVSKSVYLKFPFLSQSRHLIDIIGSELPLFAVVWTTTPWTLPFNQAICFNDKLKYCILKDSVADCHYVCEDIFTDTLKSILPNELKVIAHVEGFSFAESTYQNPLSQKELPFLPGDHVVSGKGTGFVHTAPAHGHDDFIVAVKHHLPKDCHVDREGRYISGVEQSLLGKIIGIDADDAVLDKLIPWVLKVENYVHSYPYDWRTKKPVIIRASKQWFINTHALQDKALENLNQVRIIPQQSERGMLAEIKSRPYWCISRQRVWGVPIPVFYHKESGEPLITKETVQHMCNLINEHGSDCWWTLTISQLLPNELLQQIGKGSNAEYIKGEDILDIWFDSGVSWAPVLDSIGGQADTYLEGIDQFKGWFQTSLLTKVAVDGTAPYKQIITHGFATDEDGRKMSKSLGNVVDPDEVINGGKDKKVSPSYGVDVLRWWVAHSHHHNQIMIGSNILRQMNEDVFKIRKCMRHLLGNLYDFKPDTHLLPYSQLSILDKYLLHALHATMEKVLEAYENISYHKVIQNIEKFVHADISSFYLSITKDRCYSDAHDSESRRACQTVQYHSVRALSAALAPILPHMAEEIHQHCPNGHIDMDSVFKAGFYDLKNEWKNVEAANVLMPVFEMRRNVNEEIGTENPVEFDLLIYTSPKLHDLLREIQPETTSTSSSLCEIFQTSQVTILDKAPKVIPEDSSIIEGTALLYNQGSSHPSTEEVDFKILVIPALQHKCERCRRYTAKKSNVPCDRCLSTLAHDWSR